MNPSCTSAPSTLGLRNRHSSDNSSAASHEGSRSDVSGKSWDIFGPSSFIRSPLEDRSKYAKLQNVDDEEAKVVNVEVATLVPDDNDSIGSASDLQMRADDGDDEDDNENDLQNMHLSREVEGESKKSSENLELEEYLKLQKTARESRNSQLIRDKEDVSTKTCQDVFVGHEDGGRPLLDDDELSEELELDSVSHDFVSRKENVICSGVAQSIDEPYDPVVRLEESFAAADVFSAAPFRKASFKKVKNAVTPCIQPMDVRDMDIFAQAPFKKPSKSKSSSEVNISGKVYATPPINIVSKKNLKTSFPESSLDSFGSQPFYILSQQLTCSSESLPMEMQLMSHPVSIRSESAIGVLTEEKHIQDVVGSHHVDLFGSLPFNEMSTSYSNRGGGTTLSSDDKQDIDKNAIKKSPDGPVLVEAARIDVPGTTEMASPQHQTISDTTSDPNKDIFGAVPFDAYTPQLTYLTCNPPSKQLPQPHPVQQQQSFSFKESAPNRKSNNGSGLKPGGRIIVTTARRGCSKGRTRRDSSDSKSSSNSEGSRPSPQGSKKDKSKYHIIKDLQDENIAVLQTSVSRPIHHQHSKNKKSKSKRSGKDRSDKGSGAFSNLSFEDIGSDDATSLSKRSSGSLEMNPKALWHQQDEVVGLKTASFSTIIAKSSKQ